MLRTVATAIGFVIVGWCVAIPQAAADNPVCSTTWCAFLAPSGNLSCEIDYQRGSGISDETYCQTNSPPQSVQMTSSGAIKPCTGEGCLGNAGEGTPTLGYGQTAGIGPFSCRSETSGVTCTVTSGRGFTISTEGITPTG
ncbi:hypothetical protein MKUB_33520 [Mycobacterium kubicae]|uniref:Uncharacterized protein n=1 Tax=Mycobacterium kubicae TaxID=120959 RepID=A0AAX1J8I8_9MYCO|nr:hypothetical protein [Mycobacterium kubicae]MCV7095225.1 hypothetical protein [Mycobacterium kubicae]OBF15472.1 hypothetical protein A5725_04595 [Mycobacterium kubicae]OBK49303.1 hypothetical protein A5657_22300 [Mycobacterium kubicae]ORV95126.1 hypothetical protein AWC13_21265 [Mycobacterium kubicae]QNI09005.1 hypothetical protein GAN17_24235 [Mycobacterium kubicae]